MTSKDTSLQNHPDPAKKGLWDLHDRHHTSIIQELDSYIKTSVSDIENAYILIVEIERMAPLVYTYGEELALTCTQTVESILKEELPTSYNFRSSIDRFIICTESKQDYAHFSEKILRIIKRVKEFGIHVRRTPVFLQLKIGITKLSKDLEIHLALDQALVALHEIKADETESHTLFDPESEKLQEFKAQVELASYFLSAIDENRLRLAFQPVVDTITGKVKSYEALLRIVTAESQIITAGPFIPVAENFGFIDIIDTFVLKLVVRELKLDPTVKLAMNVSNMTVSNPAWLALASELLADESIASRLIVELTETGLEKSLSKISVFVDKLQSLGVQIAIDDFGAGYTSFKQLKIINADILKIDGVFIRDIVENHDSRLFVKTLLEFSRAYNLKTVAEFVETGEIARILMQLGVDYLQGYYFGKAFNYRPWIDDDRKG